MLHQMVSSRWTTTYHLGPVSTKVLRRHYRARRDYNSVRKPQLHRTPTLTQKLGGNGPQGGCPYYFLIAPGAHANDLVKVGLVVKTEQ